MASVGLTAAVTSITAVGTGIAALGVQCVNSYAEYEQLTGGVDTLFKESANAVQAYADNAYKTAGMSANAYMETVTSFSASLLQSLEGDTAAATEAANQAITDMSDNANKMGTDMALIQNAYQGFAKQNYTMLDNLKLGYGGTKAEMERLLADATALSGVEYDISSYADVVSAIHVVQTEIGITGTTAKEASTTIQGSASSMKSAWENFLTGMADPNQDFDALTNNLMDSVMTFADNLIPRITMMLPRLVSGLISLVNNLIPQIPPLVQQLLPAVIDGAVLLLGGIVAAAPQLISMIAGVLPQLLSGIMTVIMSAMQSDLPKLIPDLISVIVQLITMIADNLPEFTAVAITMIEAIGTALLDSLPVLVDAVMVLLNSVIESFSGENMQILSDAILNILISLFAGIWNSLPSLLSGLWDLVVGYLFLYIDSFTATINSLFQENLTFDEILEIIGQFFVDLWENIKSACSDAITWLTEFFSSAWNSIVEFFTESIPAFIDSVIAWLAELPYNVGVFIGEIIGTVIKFLSELPGKVWEWLVNVSTKIEEFKKNAIAKAIDFGTTFVQNIIKFISELPDKIKEWLDKTIPKLNLWISNMKTKGKDAIDGLIEKVLDGAKNIPNQMLTIGKNIVDGVWQGICNAKDTFMANVGSFFSGIVDGAKSALGIHSPSKEFAYVGKMCVAGYEEGAKDLLDGSVVARTVQASLGVATQNSIGGGGYSTNNSTTLNFYDTQTSPDAIFRKFQTTMTYGLAGGV